MAPRILLAALLIASVASAAPHHVTPDGGASWSEARDPQTPASLSTANAHVQPGDTVRLHAGTYGTGIAPARSGTAGRRITYANARGARVVIRGADHAILLDERSYVTVRGIHADSCRQFLIIRAGHHNDIGMCTFQNNATREEWMGSWVHESSTYNRIHDCVFRRFGWVAKGDDKGILLDIGYDVSTTDATDFNVIEDNLFAYGGHHSLHICGAHNVVRNNTFHNEAWMPCERGDGRCGNRNVLTIGPMSRRNLFEGNRLGFAGTPPDDNGANGLVVRSPDNIVRRNVSYGNDAAGLALASMTVSVPTGNRIYHNTILHNGYGAEIDSFWTAGITFGNWGNGPMPGNVLVNNLVSGSRDGRALGGYGEAGEQILRGNWLEAGDPGLRDAALPEDPADFSRPDVRLRSDSPAVDAGAYLTHVVDPPDGEAASPTLLHVEDPGFFFDGWGIPGELGDRIQLQGDTTVARILAVDDDSGRLELDRSVSWRPGQGVALAYAGTAPDIGARERDGGADDAEATLFREDFDAVADGDELPPEWWVEGGQRVWVEAGRLHVRADPAADEAGAKVCTVWLDRDFGGDLRLEFDAHVIASGRRVNNVNLFFLYADPSGRRLRATRAERADAAYGRYHGLDGYIVTFLQDPAAAAPRWRDGTPKARVRLRRCPGFRLVDEGYDLTCRAGVTYHVTVTRRGSRVSYAVDGVEGAAWDDPAPLGRGHIGLRTFHTELWWDNIEVTALRQSDVPALWSRGQRSVD